MKAKAIITNYNTFREGNLTENILKDFNEEDYIKNGKKMSSKEQMILDDAYDRLITLLKNADNEIPIDKSNPAFKEGGNINDYEYLKQQEISKIVTKDGREFDSKSILDGAYIKSDSKEDKTLLAPNGKPSKLTPEQYKLVRTPEFINWFGDWINDPQNASKVVDSNGEPLVVWHGTDYEIKEFMPYAIDDYYEFGVKKQEKIFRGKYSLEEFKNLSKEKGWRFIDSNFWFSKNNAYSGTKNQYPCFLKIIELKEQTDNVKIQKPESNTSFEDFGIKVLWSDDDEEYFCVFNSNQIKLADGTNTTFDPNNDDIRFEEGGNLSNNGWNNDYENDPMKKFFDRAKEKAILAKRAGLAYLTKGKSEMGNMPLPNQNMERKI